MLVPSTFSSNASRAYTLPNSKLLGFDLFSMSADDQYLFDVVAWEESSLEIPISKEFFAAQSISLETSSEGILSSLCVVGIVAGKRFVSAL